MITLLVVVGLLVALDRVGLMVAERAVATEARTSGGLAADPAVKIKGFPFLTQALRGSYDEVEVSAHGIMRGGVTLRSFTADLRDVQVPVADAVKRQLAQVPVSRLTATAVIAYADIASARGVDRKLVVAPSGDGLVRVTGSVSVLGETLSATALSSVRLDGRTVVVTARRFEVGGKAADAALASALAGRLDLRVPVGALPYGLVLTGLTITKDGIVLTAEAGPTILR